MKDVVERWVRFDGLYHASVHNTPALEMRLPFLGNIWFHSVVIKTDLVECPIRSDILDNHIRKLFFRSVGMSLKDPPALILGSDGDYCVKAVHVSASCDIIQGHLSAI